MVGVALRLDHFCMERALMRATAGSGAHVASNVVDLYNSATGTWSTAQLSVARSGLAAASVGNVALFAGGWTGAGSALLCREGSLGGSVECCVHDECLRVLQCCGSVLPCDRLLSHERHCRCNHFWPL
jgi:hypothetical protein